MSKDSLLKKEFKKSDVQRARNLISKNFTANTKAQSGYKKHIEKHIEGDIWEEAGRQWTIKKGVKQNITRLDKAKKSHIVPLFCPKCKKVMNKGMDPSYYQATDQCFKCFKKFETQLRATGLWDEWEKRTFNGNIDSFITWYKDWVMDSLNVSNDSFISEKGDVETWRGGVNKSKAIEALNNTIKAWEEARK